MSDLVDSELIEDIVGAKRHPTHHMARVDSVEQTVYILHSQTCLESVGDLRDCDYSLALDEGIDLDRWEHFQDQAMFVAIEVDGFGFLSLVPDEGDEVVSDG